MSDSPDQNSPFQTPQTDWEFAFVLNNQMTEAKIPPQKCEELLDVIIDWAEKNGYGIGGSFGPCEADPEE